MNWLILIEISYVLLIILVCIRILFDTGSTTKAAAYMLLVIFLPFIGIFIYFSVGVNYRKRKLYSKNLFSEELEKQVFAFIEKDQNRIITKNATTLSKYSGLANLVLNQSPSALSDKNNVEILLNGENKFPSVFQAIENAKNHIHLEYYIYDLDTIGLQLIDILIKKAQQGIKVRFIYDDFGAHQLRKQVKKMQAAGIEVFPFYKISIFFLANRMNYRNHRKIIVVDGETGFVGGINVSDKYINNEKSTWFWRDTHLKLQGSIVHALQYIFMVDWNYCSGQKLQPDRDFPPKNLETGDKIAQIVASGPDSDTPLILHSLCKAISLAQKEVLITNPYFIPEPTLMDTILITAASGISVKLLVPGVSDSVFINIANHSQFAELLSAGVEIYTYQKGFVHAKSIVIDNELAIVGTANMDFRSFDLNFEVNAMVYDKKIANALSEIFYTDLQDSDKIEAEKWNQRPMYRQLLDRIVRLASPLL